MVLLRQIIGETLRTHRRTQHRTLRDVATAASVSLGYLSEVERGQKEPSSELLSSICEALDMPLSVLLDEVVSQVAREEDLVQQAADSAPIPQLHKTPQVTTLPVVHDPASNDSAATETERPLATPVSLTSERLRRARTPNSSHSAGPKASLAA